jgi:hypothetical protein
MILSIEEILTSLITIYRRMERRIDHRLKHVLPEGGMLQERG